MHKLKKILVALIIPFLFIIIWEGLSWLNFLPSSLDARPSDIFIIFFKFLLFDKDYSSYNIYYNIGISIWRLVIGVSIGSIIGLLSAYLNSKNKISRDLSNPFLTVIGPIPIVIWIPVFMLIFNGNPFYKIGLIALATFLLIYLSMYSSFSSIDKKFIELSQIYEKGFWTRFAKISVPYGLDEFYTNLRFSIAIGWIVLFIVEYSNAIMNCGGLGYTIERFRKAGKTEEMFASVLILAVISYFLDKIIVIIKNYQSRWKSKTNE